MPDESYYRRDEDKEWRKIVDRERLVLTTAVNLLQQQVREMKRQQKETDDILRGKEGKPGLLAEYERHDRFLTKIDSVIFQDATGKKGLLHDIDVLMGRKRESSDTSENHWRFATTVAAVSVTATATIIATLLAIEPVRNAVGGWFAAHLTTHLTTPKKNVLKRSGSRKSRHIKKPAASEAPKEAEHGADTVLPDGRSTDGRHAE